MTIIGNQTVTAAADKLVDERLVRTLRAHVAERLARRRAEDQAAGRPPLGADDERAYAAELLRRELDAHAQQLLEHGMTLDAETEQALARAVRDALFGLGRLQALLDDEAIENIDANGCDEVWVEYADGTVVAGPPLADSDDELVDLIRSMAAFSGHAARRFDMGYPLLDLRLPGGHRLAAMMGVSTRPALSIRRPRYSRVFLDDLVRLGALDQGLAAFLAAAVRAKRNIVIAGETGAGKTTLLRALANEIPPDERLITIENALELGLHEHKDLHPNIIALEARQANIEGEGEITMAQLVQRTLRHNPSRVIVGEVLGDEAVAMLEAMSQGNAGSLCTIHSPSAEFTFQRLAMYAGKSAQRLPVDVTYQMIVGAIDLVVFIHQHVEGGHGNSDGQRRRVRHVASVLEVLEAEGRQIRSNQVFRPGLDGRAIPYTPPRCLDLLILEGYDAALFQQPTDWPGGSAT
jgi:Flp pilus assembly CpaF family ATPase